MVVGSAAFLMQDLRPGALLLAVAGLAAGLGAHLVLALPPARRAAMLVAAAALAAIAFGQPSIQDRMIRNLEAAAKVHTGHVFTIGHDYRLLDSGFYVNPVTPAASVADPDRRRGGDDTSVRAIAQLHRSSPPLAAPLVARARVPAGAAGLVRTRGAACRSASSPATGAIRP